MDLHLVLEPGPKRAQLERALRDGVRTGRLRPGTRLPPSRRLARDLGVSRGVVVDAYAQLAAEGWLAARRGAGTVVANVETPEPASVTAAHVNARPVGIPAGARFDLRTGRPDLSAFPRAAWHAAIGRALRELPDEALGYGDFRGHEPLREALAAHLGRTRGVVADPERVVVCGGLYQGLHVVWRALARRGARRIAVEDPGWRGQRRSVEQASSPRATRGYPHGYPGVADLEMVPVPVDEHGLDVAALAAAGADAVVVTPAHQYPTGVVLAPERRAALVTWAREQGAVVVEDDYDAEYRYDREPVGALQGLAPDHVVYAGSASKTLAPALRLAWMAVPERLAADVAREKDRADRGTPVLDQAALADLLLRGEVDRHLRRMRRRYRSRRDALVAALGEHLPEAPVRGVAAGLHVVLELPDGVDEAAAQRAARKRGVLVEALQRSCTAVAPRPPALLLGYAALPEDTLTRAARELASAVRACASP
jgi:GntR family transcriptional regulator / MocR family aminotransferase